MIELFALGISILSLLAGVFTHYVFVRVKLAVQDEKIKSLIHRVDAHENYLPEINTKVSQISIDIAVIKSKIEKE